MEGDLKEPEAAQARRKPDGGFCFFTVTQLVMAWTALREAHIGLKELRAYFALGEMKSRRCGAAQDSPPEFTPLELRRLIGGEGGEREAVRTLEALGLVREVSKATIEFATDPGELRFEPKTLDATLVRIPNPDRRVPVPRRIIRLIAGGARRTLIATILGHLIRCLFYKQGACHPKGCVKAAWIARVFGISERRVHEQRQHLVAIGWLLPQETSQRTMNGHGLWVTINLAWNGLTAAKQRPGEPAAESVGGGEGAPELASSPAESPAKLSPPPAQNAGQTVTPYRNNQEPLPRGSKNQEPASGGPTGVSIPESKKTNATTEGPTLRDVKAEDLRDPARLLALHAQAVAAGYISPSEADRLNVFAAAHHARVIGSRNPPGLFVRLVRSGLWNFLTQDDEDAARVQLRRALYGEPVPVGLPRGEAPRPSPGLSADARFVRDVTNQLRQRGIPESSVWRLVNRERPEWTRARWDAALAELRGEVHPVAVGCLS